MRLAAPLTLLLLTAACSATPPPPSTEAPTQAPPTTSAAPTAKTCTVPNVVGMIHQTAQDTMQAAGLYFLTEEDASGQGRLLINDRNWKTTKQNVEPGTVVDCNTKILLSAEKID
ncbi:PASTA domain-containing protein [Lentzea fradiae]|nr:PASTA domain-containing protein [Lentzea fradiae]